MAGCINLEPLCAEYGMYIVECLPETPKLKLTDKENVINKALGVLAENGFYAMGVFLLSANRSKDYAASVFDMVMALLNDPKILFLDEPTTGLDPMSRKIVWDYIEYLRKEKQMTLFLTTHYMEEVRDADRVVVIDKGRIIAEDSPLGLKNRFTTSKLIWYTDRGADKEKLLEGMEFDYDGDHYTVKLSPEGETGLTEYLYENKDIITDYEVIKGTMDDVFLTLTGRKMGE